MEFGGVREGAWKMWKKHISLNMKGSPIVLFHLCYPFREVVVTSNYKKILYMGHG